MFSCNGASLNSLDPLLLEITVSEMERDVAQLQETVTSLRSRVDRLEGLHQRVAKLEQILQCYPLPFQVWQPPQFLRFDQPYDDRHTASGLCNPVLPYNTPPALSSACTPPVNPSPVHPSPVTPHMATPHLSTPYLCVPHPFSHHLLTPLIFLYLHNLCHHHLHVHLSSLLHRHRPCASFQVGCRITWTHLASIS